MKTLRYPKTYATITNMPRSDYWLIAWTDDGRKIMLKQQWRNGFGASADMVCGQRIKIYQKPHCKHPNFRFVGS